MKVIKNANGNIINIGEWDYQISTDTEGNEIINNPFPLNAVESDEEITILDDGSRIVANKAYWHKRKAAYPPISDQLDIIYHYGFDYWKSVILEVKNTYPKEVN